MIAGAHRGPEENGDAKHTYGLKASRAIIMDRPCHKNAYLVTSKEHFLWRITGKKVFPRRPEKMLQRHLQCLTE